MNKKNMKIKINVFLALSILLVSLIACNIFNPIAHTPSSADAKILEAEKLMEKQDSVSFAKALNYLDQAILLDSSKSRAWYLRGKVNLRIRKLDLTTIWREIGPQNTNTVPFLYQPGTVQMKYNPTTKVYDTVKVNGVPVKYPLIDAPSAIAGKTVMDSVFNFVSTLHEGTKLAYNDLKTIENLELAGKSDGAIRPITYRLDYGIESFLTVTLELLADFDQDGWVKSDADKKMYRNWCNPDYADFSDIKNIKIDSIKSLSKDPNNINKKIDSTLSRIDGATLPSIDSLKAEFRNSGDPTIDSTITDKFEDFAVNIRDNISKYYYKDGKDNDSNYYDTNQDGIVQKMVWIDYDGDGLIDVEKPSGDYYKYKDITPGIHIGDEKHWLNNLVSNVYGAVDQYSVSWYKIDSGGVTYDSIKVIKFKKYTGQPSGEWISGDWGVDEEKLDGKDNDRDGIIDEDSHIVEDTLDDDADWFDTNQDGKPNIMIWVDTDKDGKIDLDNNQTHSDGKKYLGQPPVGEWKSGDWGVDEEILDGKDNDGDGKIDEDICNRNPAVPPSGINVTGYGY